MSIYRKVLITVDPETTRILNVYRSAGYTVSGTIRRAVENYFRFNKPLVKPDSFDGVDVFEDGEKVINLD